MPTPTVLILYSSQYGYTRQYAQWLAQDLKSAIDLKIKLLQTGQVKSQDISSAAMVIVGAADYGGLLSGANQLKAFKKELLERQRIFFTVSFSGLAGASQEKLDAIVTKNYGKELTSQSPIFHYRGGLDHTRLSLKHKSIMVGIRAGISALPKKNIANQQMLDSFEQKTVDYSQRSALADLIHLVQERFSPADSA
ncbi:MAG: flavodoxin domain-containing protein [Rothia sp. (in: high G+C Gram-positive bacteria)]|nr:flavodoxin domain-containing protein [Rothia sp. (in: high G+C Gram-positive bacteria)]